MAEQTVAALEAQQSTTESMRTQERYVAPPVDIYETPEELVVLADVPGVTQEALDVRVDKHVLTIRGQASQGVPGEATAWEYVLVHFFRQFALGEQVDPSQITADLKHGVLTVHLPKAQAAPPRQIAVHAA